MGSLICARNGILFWRRVDGALWYGSCASAAEHLAAPTLTGDHRRECCRAWADVVPAELINTGTEAHFVVEVTGGASRVTLPPAKALPCCPCGKPCAWCSAGRSDHAAVILTGSTHCCQSCFTTFKHST